MAKGEAGCLFRPALPCEGSTVRDANGVSKMGLKQSSDKEFAATQRLRDIVTRIPHFQNYFVVPLSQCMPAELDDSDLRGLDQTCRGYDGPLELPQAFLNQNRDLYRIIQMADGGTDFFRAARNSRRDWSFPGVLTSMCDLLENGIRPMNAAGVLHFDLKCDNIVFDGRHVRLIDWDHAVFISDFENNPPKRRKMSTMVGKPVSYAFHVTGFLDLVENNKNMSNDLLADEILQDVIRLHEESEEDLAKLCGVPVPLDNLFFNTQVLYMLTQFRRQRGPGEPWEWNRAGYVKLLQRNYDVYGWCMLVLYLLQHSRRLFIPADVDILVDNGFFDRWTNTLKRYVYNPYLLTQPYNIFDIVSDVRILIEDGFPLAPPPPPPPLPMSSPQPPSVLARSSSSLPTVERETKRQRQA